LSRASGKRPNDGDHPAAAKRPFFRFASDRRQEVGAPFGYHPDLAFAVKRFLPRGSILTRSNREFNGKNHPPEEIILMRGGRSSGILTESLFRVARVRF
jgi:hypothetical protein